MTDQTGQSTSGVDCRSLLWGLKRLALWGELDGVDEADPHVREEEAASAKVTIEQIAWELQTDTNRSGGSQ